MRTRPISQPTHQNISQLPYRETEQWDQEPPSKENYQLPTKSPFDHSTYSTEMANQCKDISISFHSQAFEQDNLHYLRRLVSKLRREKAPTAISRIRGEISIELGTITQQE